MPPPIEDRFLIRGRTDKHPVRTFNDTTSFKEVDISFFGTCVVYNKEITADQLYTNIEELSSKVKQFHLKDIWEFTVDRWERSRCAVICKDPRCKWNMSVVSKGRGEAWIIKKLEGSHTYKSASTRTDHTTLTASLIADVIIKDIKEDPAINIKEVTRAVRRAYPHVTPHYNRLWRGRELIVCRCFETWKGSYNLLTPLFIVIISANPGTRFSSGMYQLVHPVRYNSRA